MGRSHVISPDSWLRRLPGLERLWQGPTLGDPSMTVAVLDGAVDSSHPCFAGATLQVVETVVSAEPVSAHGTGVASILFGHHASGFAGLVPNCRGLIVPIFSSRDEVTACSQLDLARALGLALSHGANVVNISGGELVPGGEASPVLANAIENCATQGVLIIAAAGNEGCDCLHTPAAAPSVLAVGAMDEKGTPIEASNWGKIYQSQGILAPGKDLPAAVPGGGVVLRTGTSWATPVVTGVAALLLSLQRRLGRTADAREVRAALLETARGCDIEPVADCRRLLAGRLDVASAVTRVAQAAVAKQTVLGPVKAARSGIVPTGHGRAAKRAPESALMPADEGTGTLRSAHPSLAYVVGRIGYDFGTEARRDSFVQLGLSDSHDVKALLAHLTDHPAHAGSVVFTLLQGSKPVYALAPHGPFAAETYRKLREIMAAQVSSDMRCSIPGWTHGTITLMHGQRVPLLFPELRGISGISTPSLVSSILGKPPHRGRRKQEEYEKNVGELVSLLERVSEEVRNLGLRPQERAMGYATSSGELGVVYGDAFKAGLKLASTTVERSPSCRPGSDSWDVVLTFFHPTERLRQARRVYRLTVDVSEVIPVTIGKVRSWDMY